tara:strand:- start:1606 stop:1833 length:228 start_codon:yes stop_codon:yes gene_type:complete
MGIGVIFCNDYSRKFSGKQYSYLCTLNDIELDDLVVVDARGKLEIVKVTNLDARTDNKDIEYKEILHILPRNLIN